MGPRTRPAGVCLISAGMYLSSVPVVVAARISAGKPLPELVKARATLSTTTGGVQRYHPSLLLVRTPLRSHSCPPPPAPRPHLVCTPLRKSPLCPPPPDVPALPAR